MLLTAVLAAPEWVLVVNRLVPDEGEQLLTYSIAQGILVEQFQAMDGGYLLTQLPDQTALLDRLCDAFQVAESHSSTSAVQIDTVTVETILAKREESTNNSPKGTSNGTTPFTQQLAEFRRHGRLRSIHILDGQLQLDTDVAFVRDRQDEVWAMAESEPGKLTFSPLTQTRLAELLADICPVKAT